MPWFFNRVIEVDSALSPEELLRECQRVENEMGRVRDIAKGPRTIDLDILLFGDLVADEPHLKIPHPLMAQRRFVLEPLAEIAPGFIHPVLQKTIKQLLGAINDPARAIRLDA